MVLGLDMRFLGGKWQKKNLLREQRQSNESLRSFDFAQGHVVGIQPMTKNGVQVWIFFRGCYQASRR
jgi:hypothetical protein